MKKGLTLIEIIIAVAVRSSSWASTSWQRTRKGSWPRVRNSKRTLDLQLIGNTIRENYTDSGNETLTCAAGPIPTSTKNMGSASGSYNIAPCIVLQQYGLYSMPYDPNATSAYYTSLTNYNSGYSISINASGTITLTAPHAELNKTISVTR